MFHSIRDQIISMKKRDPAARSFLEIILCYPGLHALFFHRIAHVLWNYKLYLIARFVSHISRFLTAIEIHPAAKIGTGFLIAHVGGIVVGGGTIIGNNCDIRQNITFGGNFNKMNEEGRTQPLLEDNVSIGAGACILGPVTIGAQSIIGANSVVTRDVPAGKIAFGIPAKVIKDIWNEHTGRKL